MWMSETEEALVRIPGLPSLAWETMALRTLLGSEESALTGDWPPAHP